jgi:Fic family protein
MAETPDTGALFSLLEDENLSELLHRSTRECLAWDEFLRMRLPQGVSAMDTWDLLQGLRRTSAIYFPIPDVEDWVYWYTSTHQINAAIALIECTCRHGSTLHRAVSEAAGQQFLVRSRIEESVAAVQLDGLIIPEEKSREMLALDRAPRNANERLLSNTVALISQMDEYVEQPFSCDLLMHLHERVLEGIDPEQLQTTDRRHGFGQEDFSEDLMTRRVDRQIDLICDYANGTTGDRFDHAIVRALIVREAIRGYRVLPVASGAVSRLAFALCALKSGFPVLAVLPISQVSLEWEEGRRTVPSFNESVTFYTVARYKEYDLTPFVTIATQLTLQALQELGGYIERSTQRDEEIRAALQEDALLNHRQRSILGRALRNPQAEFRIRYHKTKHNIAYATARADLMKLAEMGYLVQEQRGKAFVFVAHPDLKSRLKAG